MMTRLKTGIKGFDNLIKEGIPRGSNILVYGKAGCGKTIMGIEYVYRGVEQFSEPGVYISFEQTKDDLIEQAERFGWNLKKYINNNTLSILSHRIDSIDRDFANKIIKESKRIGAKRIVIDNLAMLSMSPLFGEDTKNRWTTG